jgi:hypothetical protein
VSERGRSEGHAVRRSPQGNQAAERGRRRRERNYEPSNERLQDGGLTEDELADGQPDVLLDVPVLKVDEISLEVDNLQARISLQAQVLDLLRLHVGADVSVGRVSLDIKGVDATALLKVRLDNVAEIVDRVMTTLDENPDMLENLTRGVGAAVSELGRGTGEALDEVGRGAGGAVEQVGGGAGRAVEGVGGGAGRAVEEVGGGAGRAVEGVGGGAGRAVEEVGGGAGRAVEGAGRAAGQDLEDLEDEARDVTDRAEDFDGEREPDDAWLGPERRQRSPRDRERARPVRSHREADPPPARRRRLAHRDR